MLVVKNLLTFFSAFVLLRSSVSPSKNQSSELCERDLAVVK